MNPDPEDEQAPAEIRGGDRPEDYIDLSAEALEKMRAVGTGETDDDEDAE